VAPSNVDATALRAAWPALPLEPWRDTYATLHMWTQIVGKVRMELSPPVNHWWHVTLYVTPRGLTTSSIPYQGSTFAVNFDFIDHTLFILTSDGTTKALPLIPRSVAAFYREFMACLQALGIEVTINTLPSEVQAQAGHQTEEATIGYLQRAEAGVRRRRIKLRYGNGSPAIERGEVILGSARGNQGRVAKLGAPRVAAR